jgi:hypothetical protein
MKPLEKEEIWGIITGDIVRSSDLSTERREDLLTFLGSDVYSLHDYLIGGKIWGPDVFRGDSWQMGVIPPKDTLRLGVVIRLRLKASFNNLDTRIAIGIGKIHKTTPNRISIGFGEAFTLSGNLLDHMTDDRMLLRTEKDDTGFTRTGKALDLAVKYLDETIISLKPAQAQAVLGALKGKQQFRIAREWNPAPIRQQTVSKHLKAAKWRLISESLQFVESLIDDWENLEEAKKPK